MIAAPAPVLVCMAVITAVCSASALLAIVAASGWA